MGLLMALAFGIVCKFGWFSTPYDWLIFFILWWAPFRATKPWLEIKDVNLGSIKK